MKENKKLIEGRIYKFANYDWMVAEINGNCAVLQSCGVTAGQWPGFKMQQFGNDKEYSQNIDGLDIHEYDYKMSKLYKRINGAEFADAEYGKGLFLVSDKKAGNNYLQALKSAADNGVAFGASNHCAWIGVHGTNYSAYCVTSYGSVGDGSQSGSCVIAPAFNLDMTKVRVSGDTITLAVAEPANDPKAESGQPVAENRPADKNAAYCPKFTDDTCNCLLLDSMLDVKGCLAYADSHNMNVLYTETKVADALDILMAFQKKGFRVELRERKNITPDGLVLNQKVEVYLAKK